MDAGAAVVVAETKDGDRLGMELMVQPVQHNQVTAQVVEVENQMARQFILLLEQYTEIMEDQVVAMLQVAVAELEELEEMELVKLLELQG